MNAIEVKGLSKQYKDVTAVNDLHLSIPAGELFALLGVNGAGKTTLIKMLSCLTKPTSGDALLMGKSICRESGEVKALIGVSPQETAVAPGLTAAENLSLICGAHGFSKGETEKKVSEMLQKMGLEDVKSKRAGKLSGGWQRRLSIAMALISEPRILFLDEPSLGLDVLARSELWEAIRSLKGKITVILTTHYMEEAAALADRIGVMAGGKLLCCGTLPEILEKTGENNLEAAFIRIVRGDNA